jgi:hypothetical protein
LLLTIFEQRRTGIGGSNQTLGLVDFDHVCDAAVKAGTNQLQRFTAARDRFPHVLELGIVLPKIEVGSGDHAKQVLLHDRPSGFRQQDGQELGSRGLGRAADSTEKI